MKQRIWVSQTPVQKCYKVVSREAQSIKVIFLLSLLPPPPAPPPCLLCNVIIFLSRGVTFIKDAGAGATSCQNFRMIFGVGLRMWDCQRKVATLFCRLSPSNECLPPPVFLLCLSLITWQNVKPGFHFHRSPPFPRSRLQVWFPACSLVCP